MFDRIFFVANSRAIPREIATIAALDAAYGVTEGQGT